MIPTMENLDITKRFYEELTAIQVGNVSKMELWREKNVNLTRGKKAMVRNPEAGKCV